MRWQQIESTLAPAFERRIVRGTESKVATCSGRRLAMAGGGVSAAGRPRLPIPAHGRIAPPLKHAFNLSDEETGGSLVGERRVERLQRVRCIDAEASPATRPRSVVFRSAIGEAGVESCSGTY